MIVLGCDPGTAHFGWALVDMDADSIRLLRLGVIVTKKEKGKGVLVSDDMHRRGMELSRGLRPLFAEGISLVCAESLSYPRSSTASASIGRAWGVLDGLCEDFDVPLLSASPQAIKKAAAGRQNASKEEVRQALAEHVSGPVREQLEALAKTKREHPGDALGAVWACRNHDHLRLALKARGAA